MLRAMSRPDFAFRLDEKHGYMPDHFEEMFNIWCNNRVTGDGTVSGSEFELSAK